MKSLLMKLLNLFIMPLMYGVSLVFPYSSMRSNYLLMPFFSICMVIFMALFPILPSVYGRTFICLFLYFIFYLIVGFKFDKMVELYVDRLRAERYYRIIIPYNKTNDHLYLVEAIRLHRKYGKFDEYTKFDRRAGRLRYIEDKELIKEFRYFNRKWEFIAFVYILLHVVTIYLWNEG